MRVIFLSIEVKKYGTVDGKDVFSYTLEKADLKAEIINYGGIITKLIYKGTDVVLGRNSAEEYKNSYENFGGIIGRNANRIENAEFELGGVVYKLTKNNGRNNLHGGTTGFNRKLWEGRAIDGEEPSLELTLTSHDGEEGFPGEVKVKVTYTLKSDNTFEIHYEGESDRDTVLNMTSHSYFNLNGHNSGDIKSHTLWLDSDFYTPNSPEHMPYGEIHSVRGTAFDFKTNETLGEKLDSDFEQIKMSGGIDHNFALSGDGYRLVASLKGDKTGITMETYTDQRGMQIYTANVMQKDKISKDGAFYDAFSGVCLETQAFPNNLKYSHFPSAVLRKGEKYNTVTAYKFKI